MRSNYGDQVEYWHGVDVNIAMRRIPGLTLQGGTSTGRTVQDDCELQAKVPEPGESRATSGLITTANVTALEYCHQATNWLTQVKLLGLVQHSAHRRAWSAARCRTCPGPQITASYNLPSACGRADARPAALGRRRERRGRTDRPGNARTATG